MDFTGSLFHKSSAEPWLLRPEKGRVFGTEDLFFSDQKPSIDSNSTWLSPSYLNPETSQRAFPVLGLNSPL